MNTQLVIIRDGWRKWLMTRIGLAGFCAPWRRIYILEEWATNDQIIKHELVHIEQIDREGAIKFSVKYLWYLLRYGYRSNPYEVEAYSRFSG